MLRMCETPKSPPGDYNMFAAVQPFTAASHRVKHLNPRQGITTNNTNHLKDTDAYPKV